MKNIFAYTALGPSPAYCSINEDENGVVIVTVRAKDGREASVEIPKAEAALLQQGEPEGWREAKRIADLWFEPWGAAKAIEWEFSGDVPFTPENALRKIQRLLSASPLPPAPGAVTFETTDKIGGFDGTGIYKRSIAPDPITGQGDARSLDIKRDWCIEAAKREGDAEVGAGYHSLPEAVAALSSRQAALEEAELIERKPGDVLQEALLDLVRLCTRDNIGDLDLKLGGVVADGKDVGDWHLTLKSLATTPPAEGETK